MILNLVRLFPSITQDFIKLFVGSSKIVVIPAILQICYSVQNKTVYDVGVLLWQHVSVFFGPSSGQHTEVMGKTTAYYVL